MPIVQLPDGTKINFAKTPTPADVDFAYKKIQQDRLAQKQAEPAPETAPIDNTNTQANGGVPAVGVLSKILDLTGGKKIAQGLGQALAQKKNAQMISDSQKQTSDITTALIQKIREKKALGQDTSRLEKALLDAQGTMHEEGSTAEDILNPNHLTTESVLGDAAQLALTASGGKIAEAVAPASKATGVVDGLLKGARQGAVVGGIEGLGQGATAGLKNNEDIGGVVKDTATGGATGLIGGGILGGIVGGIGGKINSSKLRKAVIDTKEASGLIPTLDQTIATKTQTDPAFKTLVDEASKQGYTPSDINFLSTVSDADKPTLNKMFDVTVKAQSDPRQITRAADILGDNATGIVKQVADQNKTFGKAVDTTAKALKGQIIDATPVRDKALSLLEEAGVSANENGTPNWSKSIFSKTPEIKKKLMLALSDLPAGDTDAYDLHKFKKSIDEVVEYGVNGEGLKGKSASILKGIRSSADNTLDSAFPAYNEANTQFKQTRDFLDQVHDVLGKKTDITSKTGSQAFGQSFRSAFSNNKSRGKTLQLIEGLQNVAKERGLNGSDQNLLDQALYVNMLEEQFGSSATTGLAGEVTKAINKVKGVAEGIRNPVKAGLNLVADKLEKAQNITPEMKQQLLKTFLK